MPAVHDEGICLRHWEWSETSQTVSIFGRSQGLLRGLAKGARRERGRFGGGIDLLTRGAFGAIVKSTTDLATLTEWDLLESYPALRESLPRLRAAYYAADLVLRMLAPADPHPRLHDEMAALLGTLGGPNAAIRSGAEEQTAQTAHTAQALLRFQWRLLAETGVQPLLEIGPGSSGASDSAEVRSVDGGSGALWFDPREGRVSIERPSSGWRVRASTIELLRRIDREAPDAILAPIESLDRANRLLAAYLRETMQTEPATMRDLFGNIATG